jgi:hypothetical protein
VDLSEQPDGTTFLVVSAPGRPPGERPVRWTAGHRLLVAADEPIDDNQARALADEVDRGGASVAAAERYGRLLFGAAFGVDLWQELVAAAGGGPSLELAIRGPADQDRPVGPALQALRWEAIHDGTAHVAARGTALTTRAGGAGGAGARGAGASAAGDGAAGDGAAGDGAAGDGAGVPGRRIPVAIVRLVRPQAGAPSADHGPVGGFEQISNIPKVLFAIGSRLTDPRVRSGAEFMGILRQLERNGGSIQPRLAELATRQSLTAELGHFRPDILHVIGHGRWFPLDDCVKLQLRAETGSGDDWVTAKLMLGVFATAGHLPKVVVLSACQTATAGHGADPVNALPFAARLVAGGVPVVIAMAGDISDTACRVFTRALTQAISDGVALADAVIKGRQAAFHAHPDLDSTDWMLPAIFLAEHLPGDTSLVDVTAIRAARTRIQDLNLAWEPVFCGRADFVAAMDRLLDAADPLNVLVACTPDGRQSYGTKRLLRELAARAVRAGRLPVLLGPFKKDGPITRADFADKLSDQLNEIHANLIGDIDDNPQLLALLEAMVAAAEATKTAPLANAILAALDGLVAALPDGDPVRKSQQPQTVLLCHQVDQWGEDALRDLLAMLGPRGLGSSGARRVPVILTGTDEDQLADARRTLNGAAWAKFATLGRFRDDEEDPEDILAYQWWLLNPPAGIPVYAPRRDAMQGWRRLLRREMQKHAVQIYDEDALFGWAEAARDDYFTSDMDHALLDSYSRPAP